MGSQPDREEDAMWISIGPPDMHVEQNMDDVEVVEILVDANCLDRMPVVKPFNTIHLALKWKGYWVLAIRSAGFKDQCDNGFAMIRILASKVTDEDAQSFFSKFILGSCKGLIVKFETVVINPENQ